MGACIIMVPFKALCSPQTCLHDLLLCRHPELSEDQFHHEADETLELLHDRLEVCWPFLCALCVCVCVCVRVRVCVCVCVKPPC
jgi:hypothetical protein